MILEEIIFVWVVKFLKSVRVSDKFQLNSPSLESLICPSFDLECFCGIPCIFQVVWMIMQLVQLFVQLENP